MRKAALQVLLILAVLAPTVAARAADLSKPVLLVAKPELRDALYGTSVLVVKPIGGGAYAGFILNRPTEVTLGVLSPEHAPAASVADPVYIGGPVQSDVLFALVRRDDSPGGDAIELLPGLYVTCEQNVVDRLIEAQPESSRFVTGFVLWRAGELEREIEGGAWYVLDADAQVLGRSSSSLWDDLVRRQQLEARLLRVRSVAR